MNKKILSVILGGACVLCISTSSFATSKEEEKNEIKENLSELTLVEDGKVKVKIHKEEGSKEIEADLMIKPNELTLKELTKYKKKMPTYYKKLQKNSDGVTPATITLNNILTIQEFEELTQSYPMNVTRIFARTTSKDGSLGGVTVPVENGTVFKEKLDSILAGPDNLILQGIYAFEAEIPVHDKTFDNLSENESVFLVDITHNYIKENVENSSDIKSMRSQNFKNKVDVNVYDLFWELEYSKNFQ